MQSLLRCFLVLLFLCDWLSATNRASDEERRLVAGAIPAFSGAKKTYKVLVFSKAYTYYHASIEVAKEMAKQLAEKTGLFEADFSDDAKDLSAENLKHYDAVYLNNTTSIQHGLADEASQKAFTDYVKNGGGIVAIHAATDGGWPEYVRMIGGNFDGHPWTADGSYTIANEDPEHAIVSEIFRGANRLINDELYQYKDFDRESCRVLLSIDMSVLENQRSSRREDMDYAMAWVKDYGKGRVFVSSMGHNKHLYYDKAIVKMWLQGFRFALGDLAVDTQSKPKAEWAKWKEPVQGNVRPEVRFRSEAESAEAFVVQDGYTLELVAGDDMLDEPVAKRFWTLSATRKPELLANLLDDDLKSTWATKASMQNGDYIQVEFPHRRRLFKVILQAKNDDRPNVLIITADDLGWDSLGCTGNPLPRLSPHVDKLASQGLLIEHAFIATPICGPSRQALYTGQYPQRSGFMGHGVQPPRWWKESAPKSPKQSITTLLHEDGYLTGLVGKHGSDLCRFSVPPHGSNTETGMGRNPDKYYQFVRSFFALAKQEGKPFYLAAKLV
jgi:hypothetical protein